MSFLKSVSVLRSVVVLLLATLALVISDALLKTGLWFDVFREVGIALLISVTVWVVFELYRQGVAEEEWTSRIDRASKNVFFAVLRKNLPDELIQAARNLALDSALIRTNFTLTYTLRDSKYEDSPGHTQDFVLLDAVLFYLLKNVSDERIKFEPKIRIPNPAHLELKKLVTVNGFTVTPLGAKAAPKTDAAEANKQFGLAMTRFEKALVDESATEVFFALDPVEIEPDGQVEVNVAYTMAKEAEDNELFETFYPSERLTLTIVDAGDGSHQRTILARAVHPDDLVRQPSAPATRTLTFVISKYLLPHQGIIMWWRKKVEEQNTLNAAKPERSVEP